MKKTFIYISVITALSTVSCSKDFLDLDPQSTIPASNLKKQKKILTRP